jgi:hypothetical protein
MYPHNPPRNNPSFPKVWVGIGGIQKEVPRTLCYPHFGQPNTPRSPRELRDAGTGEYGMAMQQHGLIDKGIRGEMPGAL